MDEYFNLSHLNEAWYIVITWMSECVWVCVCVEVTILYCVHTLHSLTLSLTHTLTHIVMSPCCSASCRPASALVYSHTLAHTLTHTHSLTILLNNCDRVGITLTISERSPKWPEACLLNLICSVCQKTFNYYILYIANV
jgi:hypothetical protein